MYLFVSQHGAIVTIDDEGRCIRQEHLSWGTSIVWRARGVRVSDYGQRGGRDSEGCKDVNATGEDALCKGRGGMKGEVRMAPTAFIYAYGVV